MKNRFYGVEALITQNLEKANWNQGKKQKKGKETAGFGKFT